MSPNRSAIVLGASGSVGDAIVRELLQSKAFAHVAMLNRRTQPDLLAFAATAGATLHERIVPDLTPTSLEQATTEAISNLQGDVVGLSALGIGAGTAKLTIQQHRAVDVQLNAAFARGLAASGLVRHLAFMSAVGANANASENGSGAAGSSRYNRVKGESEAAVRASGLPIVSIFRPSLIVGSPHTPSILGKLFPLFSFVTPARFKALSVTQIAHAMVTVAQRTPDTSAIYHVPEMIALNR